MPFYFWETSTILFQTYLLSHLNRMTLPQLYCLHLEFYNYHSPLNRSQIQSVPPAQLVVCSAAISL